MTPMWHADLAKHDVEFWCSQISKITLEEAKVVLGGREAPTRDEALALPKIGPNEVDPGVYLGLILDPPENEESVHGYCGCATAPGKGLSWASLDRQSSLVLASSDDKGLGL